MKFRNFLPLCQFLIFLPFSLVLKELIFCLENEWKFRGNFTFAFGFFFLFFFFFFRFWQQSFLCLFLNISFIQFHTSLINEISLKFPYLSKNPLETTYTSFSNTTLFILASFCITGQFSISLPTSLDPSTDGTNG